MGHMLPTSLEVAQAERSTGQPLAPGASRARARATARAAAAAPPTRARAACGAAGEAQPQPQPEPETRRWGQLGRCQAMPSGWEITLDEKKVVDLAALRHAS